jgi:hypothetical protein
VRTIGNERTDHCELDITLMAPLEMKTQSYMDIHMNEFSWGNDRLESLKIFGSVELTNEQLKCLSEKQD